MYYEHKLSIVCEGELSKIVMHKRGINIVLCREECRNVLCKNVCREGVAMDLVMVSHKR